MKRLMIALCWLAFIAVACGEREPASPAPSSRAELEDCGKEVRDCSLDAYPTPIPANCSHESLGYAIAATIDAGSYPFEKLGCNGRYLSLRLDLGADACPPEATRKEREECAREKTAYFVKRDGQWDLIAYERNTSCRFVQELEPSFPTRFCSV